MMIETTMRSVRDHATFGTGTPEEILSDRDFLLAKVTELEDRAEIAEKNLSNAEDEYEESVSDLETERDDSLENVESKNSTITMLKIALKLLAAEEDAVERERIIRDALEMSTED